MTLDHQPAYNQSTVGASAPRSDRAVEAGVVPVQPTARSTTEAGSWGLLLVPVTLCLLLMLAFVAGLY